jgi:hypothetical protein
VCDLFEGGLPPGKAEDLFQPYSQRGANRTGLGLSIALKAVKAFHGEIYVRNLPDKGCIFTLDLPKKPPPPTSLRDGVVKAGGGSGFGLKEVSARFGVPFIVKNGNLAGV